MSRSSSLTSALSLPAIMLLLVGSSGCNESRSVTQPSSSAADAPPANTPSMRGRVLDFLTQTSLSTAVVRFSSETLAVDMTATTDASGSYLMPLPSVGPFSVFVDGTFAGTARVTGTTYRADLLVDRSTCISRYGTLTDARTLKPVVGAAVTLGGSTTISAWDGWYRIDLGCPATLYWGNTSFIYVKHADFAPFQQVVGRGIYGVLRLDLGLQRR